MMTDWCAVATIAATVIAALLGAWATHRFESRPTLVVHYGHISAHTMTPPTGPALTLHTHSVILRNTGRKSAKNVRLHHARLPDFNIVPDIPYRVETLPNGSMDIVIPTLVPGKEILISYLYAPPLTFAGVNAGVDSEEGMAQAYPVLLQRQYPQWMIRLVGGLMILGSITAVYLVYRVVMVFWR